MTLVPKFPCTTEATMHTATPAHCQHIEAEIQELEADRRDLQELLHQHPGMKAALKRQIDALTRQINQRRRALDACKAGAPPGSGSVPRPPTPWSAIGHEIAGLMDQLMGSTRYLEIPPYEVFVANGGNDSISVYAIDPLGNVTPTPIRLIKSNVLDTSNTGLHHPTDVAIAHDRVYVTNLGDTSVAPSVTVYDANADGNVGPLRTISGPTTELSAPNGVVIRRESDTVLVANPSAAAGPAPNILEFSDIPGQDAPTGRISGDATALAVPSGVALDITQRVYVAEPTTNSVLVYQVRPSTQANAAPVAVIAGPSTLLNLPTRVDFDIDANIYVTNKGNHSVTIYPPGATGDVAPTRRIGGPGSAQTQLFQPHGIAVTGIGRVFVTQASGLLVFEPGADGDAAPGQYLSEPDTGLNFPLGVALRYYF
jgi:hypothetical protein